MDARKQKLLRQHRRQKRIAMLTALVALVVIGVTVSFWLVPLLVVLGWLAHEAWFADHLFYRPQEDYRYEFPPNAVQLDGRIERGCLHLAGDLPDGETLILEVQLKATWAGRLRDPRVYIGGDRQDFERGVRGRRYLNLSGQQEALRAGSVRFDSRYCRLGAEVRLNVMSNPDYTKKRVLIIAPHADDAELAAFGVYRHAGDVSIVTLTQGEIEADNYHRLGLDSAAAARLKGRLRTWGSLAVPLWGGVPQQHCVQLGYYCLQSPAMAAVPKRSFGSRDSGEQDICDARKAKSAAVARARCGFWRDAAGRQRVMTIFSARRCVATNCSGFAISSTAPARAGFHCLHVMIAAVFSSSPEPS